MFQLLKNLRQKLASRPDTEHHQAILRLIIGTAAVIIILMNWDAIAERGDALVTGIGLVTFYVGAFAIMAHICFGPMIYVPRRYFGMSWDIFFVSFVLVMGKDPSTQGLVMIYLWIILGNGLRFGQRYLIVALVLSLASFSIVLEVNNFWRELKWFGWELLIGQGFIALYMLSLVVRLNKALGREEAANSAKRNFVSRMSHEMRTPLNNIMGSADLVLGTKLSSDQYQLLRVLQDSSIHLRRLIDDVLDFSKIEAGKLTIESREMDVRALLWNTVNMLHPQAHAKKIGMDLQIDRLLPTCVRGDELRLRQILLNLAGNAIKFTETGYVRLEVTVVERNETKAVLRFAVRDTGIGIAAEKIAKIFESFGQADESVTRKYGGTGLGVTISQNLIEIMGGELKVESTLGEGSIFSFGLPFEVAATEQTSQTQLWAGVGMNKDEVYALRDVVEQWGIALAYFEDLSKLAGQRTLQYAGLLAKGDHRQQLLEAAMFARGRALPLILTSEDQQAADAPELTGGTWIKWPIDRLALFRAINSAV